MNAQHTPGTWYRNHQGNTIRSETHGFVAGLNDVSPADARLMIAAPELLEALQMAMPHLEAAALKDNATYALARAAIAKATA